MTRKVLGRLGETVTPFATAVKSKVKSEENKFINSLMTGRANAAYCSGQRILEIMYEQQYSRTLQLFLKSANVSKS